MQNKFYKQQKVKTIAYRDLKLFAIYTDGSAVVAAPPGANLQFSMCWTHPGSGVSKSAHYFEGKIQPFLKIIARQHVDTTCSSSQRLRRVLGVQLFIPEMAWCDLSEDDCWRIVENDLVQYLHWEKGIPRGLPELDSRCFYYNDINTNPSVQKGVVTLRPAAKSQFHEHCQLDISAELTDWCPAAITPERELARWNRCAYCYVSGNNSRSFPAIKQVDHKALQDQLEKISALRRFEKGAPRVLRIGAKTDPGSPAVRKQLLELLEFCARQSLTPVVTTKFLEFDPDVAQLLKRTDGVLMPSLGNDSLEVGAVLNGRTQMTRISDGLFYEAAGATVVPFVLTDPTLRDGGPWFKDTIILARLHFSNIQLLPIRLQNRSHAEAIFGGWDISPADPKRRYEADARHRRIPLAYDKKLMKTVALNTGNIRMCAHNSCASHCGGCFVGTPSVKGLRKAGQSGQFIQLQKLTQNG